MGLSRWYLSMGTFSMFFHNLNQTTVENTREAAQALMLHINGGQKN